MMKPLTRVFNLLMIMLISVPGLASADTILPYDVLSYDLSVQLVFENSPQPGHSYRHLYSPLNTLEGEATIVVRNATPEPLDEISIIFNRLLQPKKILVDGETPEFHSVLKGLEGKESLQVLHVTVALSRSLGPGKQTELSIYYSGQLMGYPESGMLYNLETLDPDFTILRSETFCYPTLALASRDSTAASARSDLFDQHLKVTVPLGHIAVNGGRSLGTEQINGKAVYSYASREPESAILIAIAPYELVTVGPHRIYHFVDSADGAGNLTRLLDQAMQLLSSWLGPPPLKRGLVIAEIPEFFGSQAGPLIIQTSGAFRNKEQYGEFYHELSHLWNPKDIDPKPSRWNEGLAMFLQALVETQLKQSTDLDASLQRRFEVLKKRLSKDEGLRSVAMIDYGENEMTDLSYLTGALLFGLLREQVGEPALLAFLASYSRQHQEKGSRDADFAAELAATLGVESAALMEEWFLSPRFAGQILETASWSDIKSRYVTQK